MIKRKWEELIGHTIRMDTYVLLNRMNEGEDYNTIIKDLEENKGKYNLREDIAFTKETTIKRYLNLLHEEEEDLIDENKILSHIDKMIDNTQYMKSIDESRLKICHGVYGIYVENILVYIGKTNTNFWTRFLQHKSMMNQEVHETKGNLYKLLKAAKQNGKVITLRPIIIAEDLNVRGKVKDRDIDAMELALITLYQPQCNIEGRLREYKFDN